MPSTFLSALLMSTYLALSTAVLRVALLLYGFTDEVQRGAVTCPRKCKNLSYNLGTQTGTRVYGLNCYRDTAADNFTDHSLLCMVVTHSGRHS